MAVKIETQIASKAIFEMEWMRIRLDDVLIEDGQEAKRIVIEHPGAACILAITEEEKVLLVSQYRYAAQETLFEIPAGKIDTWGGDFYETAKRELAEETAFTAEKLTLLYTFYTAPGFCNEYIHLYQAEGLVENSSLGLDEDEFVEVHYFTKHEIRQMLKTGEIHDAKTIIALQFWLHEKK
ncbi:MAG: NUDIX hydrolase [Culicoidibacterales bacterium]